MKLLRRLVPVFLLAGVIVAGPANAGVIRADKSDDAHLFLAGSNAYDSVGSILGSSPLYSSSFGASAVMIDSNWALTAAHVVAGATDLSFSLGGATYGAAEWFAHDKWDGDLSKGYDIGLIRFDSAIAGVPAMLYNGQSEFGALATMVGYGMTGTGLTGATTFDGKKRAGENVIDAFLRTPGRDSRVLLTDFDNPGDSSDSSWGDSAPVGLEYLIAPGDSGGGLFIDDANGTFLAGIHSFGWGILDGNPDSDYGDASGHTRVSAFTGWIDSILNPSSGGGGGDKKNKPGTGRGKNSTLVTRAGFGENVSDQLRVIPEPTTLGLYSLSLAGLAYSRRRRAK